MNHTVKGFRVVNEAEVCFSGILLFFSMIQWMLEIWFLFPLPFLNTACTSGSSGSPTVEACLKDSEHYLANMRNECNCVIV